MAKFNYRISEQPANWSVRTQREAVSKISEAILSQNPELRDMSLEEIIERLDVLTKKITGDVLQPAGENNKEDN